jgi:precorrin-2 dehydrogenase / sirohydrochlorin ferrochelatase
MAGRSLIIGVSLENRACLVVGSGTEAEQRTLRLRECGARVTLLADQVSEELAKLHVEGEVRWLQRSFADADVRGQWLVVLTARDPALAKRIAQAAELERAFFCAVDQPAFNSFAHLALATASDLTIAISTGGRIPALARRLQLELQRLLDQSQFAEFFERLAEKRAILLESARKSRLTALLDQLRLTGKFELPLALLDQSSEDADHDPRE